jgi:hypothetical protein
MSMPLALTFMDDAFFGRHARPCAGIFIRGGD